MLAVTGGVEVKSESLDDEETIGVRQLWCWQEDHVTEVGLSKPGMMLTGGITPCFAPQRNDKICLQ